MSPERSTTPQDEAVLTPKMSVPASPVAGTPIREAQSPISLLLAVAQSQNRNGDDDLTSLSWLHERDLLKGMNINPCPSNSVNSTPIKTNLNEDSNEYVDDTSISAQESSSSSSNSSLNSPTPSQYHPNGHLRNKHPHNIPYDPLVHTNNKPPYSFSCLIFMAIEDSTQKALPVKEIYAWILEHFPYFKNAPTGWKNSVRHNLSLNKCFQKVEKAPNLGKGSLWTVDPQYKPNLIQALTRSPYHPCSTLDPSAYFNGGRGTNSGVTTPERPPSRLPNPELFPYLSRKLATVNGVNTLEERIKQEVTDDAVDAATVMLSLRYRHKKEKHLQVITTSPSQDHTYSAADTSSPFESDDERISKSVVCRKIDFEDEEERKIKEGAETLLNLAGMAIKKRRNSEPDYDCFKRMRKSPMNIECDINDNEPEERPTPFKPRLLRTKKKDKSRIVHHNNNNHTNNNNIDDEWVKHRRELEINQHR